jgi:hypothetical protein
MSKLGEWLSDESKKLQDELNAEYIVSILTPGDVAAFCAQGVFTEHVAFLQKEYGAFEIAPDGSVTMGMGAIPEYIDLEEDDSEEDTDLPASTQEEKDAIIHQWLNEFEGPNPEPKDDVIQSFLGSGDFPAVRQWQEQRDARRERTDQLRRASYYRACRDAKWFVEHSEEELEALVRETWLRNLTQAEALVADAAYVEAKERFATRGRAAR